MAKKNAGSTFEMDERLIREQVEKCKPKYNIHKGDAVKWAEEYKGEKFHALFCDPPYHLTTITKRFGKNGSKPAKYGKDGAFQRASRGFMNQTWDGGDIAFQPETWEAFKGVMHDGAFGMAFAASRNWHRMAVAIEDAGFVIHPTMFFLWIQGQGFPKATKVRAEGFEGYKYGLQALKPAVEPIIIFQKPYNGRPIDNITETGAGVLNIDGARIPLEQGDEYVINEFVDGAKPWGNGAGHEYKSIKVKAPSEAVSFGNISKTPHPQPASPLGRYPANLLLDEGNAQALDRQTGILQSGKPSGKKKAKNNIYGQYRNEDIDVTGFGDNGGASRFFKVVNEQIDALDPFYYSAKVSPKERNAGLDKKNSHPTLKPIDLCTYLAKMLLPPVEYSPRRIFVPFAGAGSEMIGAGRAGWDEIEGVELDTDGEYIPTANKRLEHWLR